MAAKHFPEFEYSPLFSEGFTRPSISVLESMRLLYNDYVGYGTHFFSNIHPSWYPSFIHLDERVFWDEDEDDWMLNPDLVAEVAREMRKVKRESFSEIEAEARKDEAMNNRFQKFPFLRLPTDLRRSIYDYVLPDFNSSVVTISRSPIQPLSNINSDFSKHQKPPVTNWTFNHQLLLPVNDVLNDYYRAKYSDWTDSDDEDFSPRTPEEVQRLHGPLHTCRFLRGDDNNIHCLQTRHPRVAKYDYFCSVDDNIEMYDWREQVESLHLLMRICKFIRRDVLGLMVGQNWIRFLTREDAFGFLEGVGTEIRIPSLIVEGLRWDLGRFSLSSSLSLRSLVQKAGVRRLELSGELSVKAEKFLEKTWRQKRAKKIFLQVCQIREVQEVSGLESTCLRIENWDDGIEWSDDKSFVEEVEKGEGGVRWWMVELARELAAEMRNSG